MTPAELKSIRQGLGLSAEAFARLTGTASGRTVRRWESDDEPRDIPGTIQLIASAVEEVPGFREWLLARAMREIGPKI